MKLAVFDLDGTLLDTQRVDADCFVEALSSEFGIAPEDIAWENARHVSDSGITDEIFRQVFSRPPTSDEIARFVHRFVHLLEGRHAAEPWRFREIGGAGTMLRELLATAEWRAAVATGGWELSAAWKLERAGFDSLRLPIATANDAHPREDIVHIAIDRARRRFQAREFERVVAIGDARWDVRTAGNLELPFVGIGCARSLSAAGAGTVVQDYSDLPAFFQGEDDMSQRIVQVDAFTAEPFRGNPAAVCVLDGPADAGWMQNVAREMSLSETAFRHSQGDGWSLRWFTPTTEVELCGHATLASAHVLWEDGHLAPEETARFDTQSGRLEARLNGEWIDP